MKQAYLLGDEYKDKGQHDTSQYGRTVVGFHRMFWWGRQYVGHISSNNEIVRSERICETIKWEEGIIVPLVGGEFIIYFEEFQTWFGNGRDFLDDEGIIDWRWCLGKIEKDIEVFHWTLI